MGEWLNSVLGYMKQWMRLILFDKESMSNHLEVREKYFPLNFCRFFPALKFYTRVYLCQFVAYKQEHTPLSKH